MFNTRLRLVVRVRLGLVVVGRCCRGPRPGGARITKDSPEHGRTVPVDILSLTVLGGIRWCVMVPPNGSRRVLLQYQFPPSHRDVADPPSTDLSSRTIQSRPHPMDPANATSIDTVIFEGVIPNLPQMSLPLNRPSLHWAVRGQLLTNSEASQWQLVLRQFL